MKVRWRSAESEAALKQAVQKYGDKVFEDVQLSPQGPFNSNFLRDKGGEVWTLLTVEGATEKDIPTLVALAKLRYG